MSSPNSRVRQVKEFLVPSEKRQDPSSIPWDPEATHFPSRSDLPKIEGAPEDAAWFWGKNDNLGRINLLTPSRVKAASSEIISGEIIPLNLPLNMPDTPLFAREAFSHEIKRLADGKVFDDKYSLNTQSGTQWDGFRHFSHIETGLFYNGCTEADIFGPNANDKNSIHHIAKHGIAGRGILLDVRRYCENSNITYDPFTRFEVNFSMLEECAKSQGIDLRPSDQGGSIKVGDILFIRSGFVQRWRTASPEEREAAAKRPNRRGRDNQQRWAGMGQEKEIVDFLHDSYFAAVAGDSPSFEAYPSLSEYYLHEKLLACWGMPIGEMFDLDTLAEKCRSRGQWTFFFTSMPATCVRGVASHANASVIL